LRPHRSAGYKRWSTGPIKGKDHVVAEPHSRVRSWGTIAAFTLIIALTIGEGIDEGFSVWDWLIMAAGAVFIVQAIFRLDQGRSAPT
jgi:hypothetical protein